MKTESTTTGSSVGGILGASNGTAHITNCWIGKDVTVKSGYSVVGNNATFVGGIAGACNNLVIEGCYSLGTVIGSANAGAITGGTGAAVTVKNSIAAAKVQAPSMAGGILCHYSPFGTMTNNYGVGVRLYAPSNGTANTHATGDALNETNVVASVGEAAYKLNANANGEIYYTLKNGELAFGDVNNQVRRVKVIRGDATTYAYVVPGSVALEDVAPGYAYATSVAVKDDVLGTNLAVNDGKFTMPKNDVTITVVDTVKSAKAALAAAEEKGWDVVDINMYTEAAAWLTAADALANSTEVAAILAKAAEIDDVLSGTLTLDKTAAMPFSKQDLYTAMGCTNTTSFSFNTAEDLYQFMYAAMPSTGSTNWGGRTYYFNRDIDMRDLPDEKYNSQQPIASTSTGTSNGFAGTIDGQGHVIKNLLINKTASTARASGAALVTTLYGGTLKNLGVASGSVNVTGATVGTGANAAGLVAQVVGGANVLNCWNGADVTVNASHSDRAYYVGGIVGAGGNGATIDGCYNVGTITSQNGNVAGLSGWNSAHANNSINAGTLVGTSGVNAALNTHSNTFTDANGEGVFPHNSYSVNSPLVQAAGSDASTTATLPNGEKYLPANINEYFAVSSVEEAAYRANTGYVSGYGNQTYYKLNDEGDLCFATAETQLRRIEIARGSSVSYAYASNGDVVDLYAINPALAAANGLSSNDVTIDGGKFTMVNKDITINVDDTVDSAKGALTDKIEEAWDAEDLNMYEETQGWLATAKTLLASGNNATEIINHVAAIDGILAGNLNLDTNAYAPYSKKAQYPNNPTTGYSINTKADWLALVNDYKTSSLNKNLYVNRDIDFGHEKMNPLGYVANGLDYATLDGQGHTFYNIKIEMEGAVANHYGVALVGALSHGATIQNLTLTGEVTNLSTNPAALTAAFAAGKNNGANDAGLGSAIINCRSDVHVKGPSNTDASNTSNGLAAFRTYVQANDKIINCINNGIVESTTEGGAVGTFTPYRGARPTIENCVDNGTLTTTGVKAAILTNGSWGDATADNNWAVNHDTWWFNKAINPVITLPNGETASTVEEVNAYYTVGSAKEAAYKATAGANGEVFYTVEDGKIAFADAKSIFAVKMVGDFAATGYYLAGEQVNLADLGYEHAEDNTLSGEQTFIMPAEDVTINVAFGGEKLAEIKAELKVLIDRYAAMNQEILSAESTVAAWLSEANALYGSNEATYTAISNQIVAADGIVAAIKDGYYVPFGTKDTVYAGVNANNNYGIYTEADWEALVNAGTVSMNTLHIMNDITFTKSHNPVAYGGDMFTGNVDGHNHVLTIQMNLTDSDLTSGVGLFSAFAGDHTIKNLGLAGTLNYTLNGSAGSKYVGGFVGTSAQRIQFIKCFTTLDISINKAQNTGHFVGAPATYNTRYDGCYAAGSLNSVHTPGTIFGFTGGYTGNAHELFNSFDATTTNADPSYMLRIHSGAISTETGEDNNNRAGNIYAVGKKVYSFNNSDHQAVSGSAAYIAWAAAHELAADAYATGEVGYLLNQGYTAKTGTRVYYAYDYANKAVVFGNDDGSNQVRKVTYSGIANGAIYVNQGEVVPFADIAGNAAKYSIGGEEIDINGYVMPAGDLEVVVAAAFDIEAYNAAKAGLEAIKAEYEKYDLTILGNGAEIGAAKDAIANLLEVDDPEAIIAAYADDYSEAITPVLGEGKKVPYATKANYSKINANNEYGIYEVADWNAAAAAGGSINLFLMNNIDFNNEETATFASFAGTFDGQGNKLENIKITTVVSNAAALFRALSGTVKNVEITGKVDVNLGTMEAKVSTASIAVVAANGASGTITGVINNADIVANVYASGRVYIGTICGDRAVYTNCTNNGDVTVTGVGAYIGVGGMAGRTGAAVSGNKNYGDVTLNTQRNNDNYAYVGGISGATSGDSLANVENHGTITLIGGSHAAVGGIQGYGTDTNKDCTIGSATNTGAINVTMDEGASIVLVGGIIGQAMWPVTEGAVLSNTGNITVEAANPYSGAYIGGIAGTMSALATGEFSATNTGAIKVGGLDAANEKHIAAQVVALANNATVNATENGSLTICDHDGMEAVHDEDAYTHTFACPDCSYKATADCDGEWVYGELTIDEEGVVTSTHALVCETCKHSYENEPCIGTLVKNDADCTADTVAKFDCDCGREDVVLAEGHDAHNLGEYSAEGATAGYLRAECQNPGCEGYEEQLIEVTFNVESEGFVPGAEGTLTVKVATGLLKAGTFTVTADGLTIADNSFTVEEMTDGAYTLSFTAGKVYEDIAVSIAITDAVGADDQAKEFANIEYTLGINVTPGDVNNDAEITLVDAIMILRELVGKNKAEFNSANADCDGQEGLTVNDAIWVVRKWLESI